jgi:hypothetical protein
VADAPAVTIPDYTNVIDQNFFIEPLGGPQNPQNYLDRFPDEVYNKTIDSHLVKFIYSLIGPAGVGWLRKNYLDARVQLEEYGVELFDLDAFYGNPLKFGRILEEIYDEDPRGLLNREQWEKIRARDAAYRARALDYVRGMRLGNTPAGMKLVARSGLGHEVEIIEHYKWLYDQWSDDPLGLERKGETNSTEEMVILPRRELAQSEIQQITITGVVSGGQFQIGFNGIDSEPIFWNNGDRETIRQFLEDIPTIGLGNVAVEGGPLPSNPIQIYFKGELSSRDVPPLYATNSLTGEGVGLFIETLRGGVDAMDELSVIPPRDQRYLIEVLEHLRPQTTISTFKLASGTQSRIIWNAMAGSSSYTEVARYVTGAASVPWPSKDTRYWIEAGVEHEGRRVAGDLQHHYIGFHDVKRLVSYDETAADYGALNTVITNTAPNEHVGQYTKYQRGLYPGLNGEDDQFQAYAKYALADYSEPLTVTTQQDDSMAVLNGIYPIEYNDLPGVATIKYRHDQFWGSREREEGTDYLEFDFGSVQAVNYITFEATRKPYNIELQYDILDQGDNRSFVPVTLSSTLPANSTLGYTPSYTNPWSPITINFTDSIGQMIYTRYLRLKFTRRMDANSPFISPDGITKRPYSVEVRNLRVGRAV